MLQLSAPQFGPLASFCINEVEKPEPGPGEVRIRVEACALGYVDILIAAGRYQLRPPLPHVPGGEIAGTVDAIGSGVAGLRIGDQVFSWQLAGGLAEYVVLPLGHVHASPPDLDPAIVASMVIDYPTAWYALFERGGLRAFETVFVLGASGGVGAAAIQLAHRAGARVVAAGSSAAKRDHALALGATMVVDPTTQDWRAALKDQLGGGGLDLVVDPVGGTASEAAFRSLGKGGRHLVIGFAAGDIPRIPTNLALLKSASLIGVDLRHFTATDLAGACAARNRMFEMVGNGQMRVPMDESFTLATAADALQRLEQRDRIGKIVVRIGEPRPGLD